MSQPSTVSAIFQCDELPGQSLSISSEGADVLEERAVQMPAPGAEQVGNRQIQTAPAQGKHWDPTTRTGWLGPHRADRWEWGGWAGLAILGCHLLMRKHYCRRLVLSFSHGT